MSHKFIKLHRLLPNALRRVQEPNGFEVAVPMLRAGRIPANHKTLRTELNAAYRRCCPKGLDRDSALFRRMTELRDGALAALSEQEQTAKAKRAAMARRQTTIAPTKEVELKRAVG